MLSETGLVSLIRKLASKQEPSAGLVRGIGDDCAVLRPRPGYDLVFTTDFVLEGRHFTLDTHTPADVGHKALARSLSDLAAMGSKPLFCLVSLALPAGRDQFLKGFYRGLLRLASEHRIALAGGDLAKDTRIVADVMCCGEVPTGKALLRNNARPADGIYVSGQLGASAHGFRTGKGTNFRRHLRPQPRVALGQALGPLGITCCMDLSDGLLLDLYRLCQESKVSAELSGELPISRGASREDALSGGEDYELLFTAPPHVVVPASLEEISITRIGTIRPKSRHMLTLQGRPISAQGFDHFQNSAGSPVAKKRSL